MVLLNFFVGGLFLVRIVNAHTKGAALMWERVHMTVTRILSILLLPPFGLNTVNAVCFAYRTSDFPYVLIWVSFQCKAMTTRTPASHAV